VFETKVTLKQAIAANGTGVRRRVPEVARHSGFERQSKNSALQAPTIMRLPQMIRMARNQIKGKTTGTNQEPVHLGIQYVNPELR
jgi:hypothetical protein